MREVDSYRSIFENAVEGIFQSTPEGKYLLVNRALAWMYGYSTPEELIDCVTRIDEQLYVQKSRRQEFVAAMEKFGKVSDFESEVYRSNRSTIWISENVRAVRDENERLLYYEGFVVEITDRKDAEDSLKHVLSGMEKEIESRTLRIRRSEAVIRALIDVMDESVILLDQAGKVLVVNEAGARRYNCEIADLEGTCIYSRLPEKLARKRKERNQKVIRTGIPERVVEYRDDMIFKTTIHPLANPDGEITQLAIIANHIHSPDDEEIIPEESRESISE